MRTEMFYTLQPAGHIIVKQKVLSLQYIGILLLLFAAAEYIQTAQIGIGLHYTHHKPFLFCFVLLVYCFSVLVLFSLSLYRPASRIFVFEMGWWFRFDFDIPTFCFFLLLLRKRAFASYFLLGLWFATIIVGCQFRRRRC